MSQEISIELAKSFVELPKLYLVLQKSKFDTLPSNLKAYATYANESLMNSTISRLRGGNSEVFLFTSEVSYYKGIKQMVADKVGGSGEKSCIIVAPRLFLSAVDDIDPEKLYIDYGQPSYLALTKSGIEYLALFPSIVALAACPRIFILQDRAGYAITMDIEKKKYAVGFLTTEDGKATLEGMRTESPGCVLEPNRPRALASSILSTDYEGIVFNPASSTQIIFERKQLEILAAATKSEGPISKLVKGLLGKS